MSRLGEVASRLAFRPDRLPRSLVTGIALVPPVGAGIAIFGLPALYAAGIAVGAGLVTHGAARLARRKLVTSPIVVALVGVGLVGPGAPLWWLGVVAVGACLLEVGRSLLPGKPLPFHSGLWAYAATYLAGRGAVAAYLAPGRTTRVFPEPIRLWHDFFGGPAAPLESVTLYVGNVAGPVFATSLLAIAIGAAWFWYARRLDLIAVVGVAAGAIAAAVVEGWNPAYQVLSGPLWFAAVYCYADRRLLAGPPLLGGVIGAAAGFIGVGLRTRGYAVEGAVVTFAAAQLLVAIVSGLGQLVQAAWRRRSPRKAKTDARSGLLARISPGHRVS